MLYREIIAVCSEIHTEHINTVWAERRIVESYTRKNIQEDYNKNITIICFNCSCVIANSLFGVNNQIVSHV